jgi:hypothetical protein
VGGESIGQKFLNGIKEQWKPKPQYEEKKKEKKKEKRKCNLLLA